MINATICTIGDEILIGQIIDTNSSIISKELNAIGIKVSSMISVSDNEDDIISSLERCMSNSKVVIVTGGLGPTKDDITKGALAKLSNSKSSYYDNDQSDIIKSLCNKRGIEVSQLNKDQALVPDECTVLTNSLGTAPGMFFRIPQDANNQALLFSLPGVPYEMAGLLPKVIEILKSECVTESIYHKTIVTYGIPESILAKRIENWEDNLPSNVKLAYLPNPIMGIRLRLSIYGGSKESSSALINNLITELKIILGDSIYGEDDDTLESVITSFLRANYCTLSTAESCTGGKIASLLTSIPGASDVYKGSVIAYHNQVKTDLLKVDPKVIEYHGAVSRECVIQMAKGVKELTKSDYAIAASGIAGPSGGTVDKPVGTLWIAAIGPDFCEAKTIIMSSDRQRNIDRFAAEALNLLRLKLGIQLL